MHNIMGKHTFPYKRVNTLAHLHLLHRLICFLSSSSSSLLFLFILHLQVTEVAHSNTYEKQDLKILCEDF